MSWQALIEAIETARAEIAAAAPDAETAAEGEAYVARVLTSTMANAFLGHLLVEDRLARALPTHGGPNPDYLMRHTGVGMESNHWTENLQTQGAHDRIAVADDDGRIRVRIGPGMPAGLANRIDTAGRRRGLLIARIIGTPVTEPLPTRTVHASEMAQA